MMPPSSRKNHAGRWRFIAFLLILGSASLHLAYLFSPLALDLAPDEAHYWDWSRHLDWSYYSKGPLVAYLIRGGTAVAGPLANAVCSNEMPAVRLPAVMCGALLLASLYVLTNQVYQNEKLACAVTAMAITLPVIGVGASLMTIDAPYTCCWGWALVFGFQAIFRRSRWAWPAAGLAIGLGILAKYTMVLWIPSIAFFLIGSGLYRSLLFKSDFWLMAAVAAACSSPIIIWNIQNDWPTWHHVSGLALGHGASGIKWTGPLAFVGAQAGLLLIYWFAAWIASLIRFRPWNDSNSPLTYLWWMSAPMFLTFLAFSFKTGGGEPNWPITAYLSGLVLAAGWIANQLVSPIVWWRRLQFTWLSLALGLGLGLTIIMHHTVWIHPALELVTGPATANQPLPLRRLDPTCRLMGFHTLAKRVDALRRENRLAGRDLVLACTSWALPGELGFYCEGHPTAYSIGLPLGDRHSQYDFWRPNPIADADVFRGRDFLIVGDLDPRLLEPLFERVESQEIVTHYEDGRPVARWTITRARRFRGFDPNVWEKSDRPY